MPVIIPEKDYDRWLKPELDRPPIDLLRPYDADKMTAWKVDKAVGKCEERFTRADQACFSHSGTG
jgi:putative SOS response-associated peptidase YedK